MPNCRGWLRFCGQEGGRFLVLEVEAFSGLKKYFTRKFIDGLFHRASRQFEGAETPWWDLNRLLNVGNESRDQASTMELSILPALSESANHRGERDLTCGENSVSKAVLLPGGGLGESLSSITDGDLR